MTALALAALLLSTTPADTVHAMPSAASTAASSQAPGRDQMADDPLPIQVRPVVPLSALYSGTFGVGAGAGVRIENLAWEGSDVTATAFGALYGYGADLTLRSGDPYDHPVYGLVRAEASRATRRRFYGAGPFTDEADRLDLDHTSASVEARAGVYPLLTTALLIQPSARLLVDRLDTIEPDTEALLARLDADSQASVRAVEAETRVGVSFGLEIASDRLDWHDDPSSGTLASLEVRRFQTLDGTGLGFTRVASTLSGYLPVRRRTALFAHAVGAVTRTDEDAALPFVYLPTLDNDLLLAYATDRFRGNDVLALAVGARAPVASIYGIFGIDAEVTATVGSVYDDVFSQFTPAVSFDAPVETGGTAQLRPAASVALRFVNIENQSVVVGGRVGVSPEGLALALVSLRADLRDLIPLFR